MGPVVVRRGSEEVWEAHVVLGFHVVICGDVLQTPEPWPETSGCRIRLCIHTQTSGFSALGCSGPHDEHGHV